MRRGLVSDPGTPEEILDQVRRNLATLADWVADSRIRYAVAPGPDGELILDLETAGFGGTDLQALRFVDSQADGAGFRLYADTNRNGRLDPDDASLTARPEVTAEGARLRLEEPLALLSGWRAGERGIHRARVHYRLFVTGRGAAGITDRTEVELTNRMTGAALGGERVSAGTPMGGAHTWHPWRYPRPDGRTVRLAGTVTMSETLMLSPDDRLVIEPGTTIRLAPDASIVSRGRVIALGQPGREIRVVPAQEGSPWGAFVLQGVGADSSVFRHMSFSGGGGARVGRVDYKGMVSVHQARGVVFEDARFEDNLRSDDALNAVHADVTLERCIFRRANGDAVDYDYSAGAIVGCAFEDSRNDAIDLMTSSPLIASNRIVGSGDKGISIGERSSPSIIDNHISSSVRGLEIKDRSDPLVLHTTIERNGIGVLVQVKNWRYGGGGWARILYSRVSGNETDLQVDESSLVTLYESQVGDDPITADAGQGARWIHASVGATGTRRAGVRAGRPELEPPTPPQVGRVFPGSIRPGPGAVVGPGCRSPSTHGWSAHRLDRAGGGRARSAPRLGPDRPLDAERAGFGAQRPRPRAPLAHARIRRGRDGARARPACRGTRGRSHYDRRAARSISIAPDSGKSTRRRRSRGPANGPGRATWRTRGSATTAVVHAPRWSGSKSGWRVMNRRTIVVASLLPLGLAPATGAAAGLTLPQASQGSVDTTTFVVLGHVRGEEDLPLHYGLDELLREVRAAEPDFAVLTGDMIWGDPGPHAADREKVLAQWEALDSAVATLNIPIHRTPGNHDIRDRVQWDLYQERYGPTPAAIDHGRVRLLLLNSSWRPKVEDGLRRWFGQGYHLDDDDIRFLEEQLADESAFDHAFVFLHHHFWWGEDDGPWWQEVHPVLADAGVRAVFTGDYGPQKFSHMEKDGVEYYQTAMAPDASLGILRGHEWNRILAAQFDNYAVVRVVGEEVEVEIRTLREVSSGHFTPQQWLDVWGTTVRPPRLFFRGKLLQLLEGTRAKVYVAAGLGLVFLGGLVVGIVLARRKTRY